MNGWDRTQRAVFHRAESLLYYWKYNGYQVLWVTLTSGNESYEMRRTEGWKETLEGRHRRLLERIRKEFGFDVEFLCVHTVEGERVAPEKRGVLHLLWAWRKPVGWKGKARYFFVRHAWLSKAWQEIHGARSVWVSRVGKGETDSAKLSRYVVSQYCAGQKALYRFSWSWRKTFRIPIRKAWRVVKGATIRYGWAAVREGWHTFLRGEVVEVRGRGDRWGRYSFTKVNMASLRDRFRGVGAVTQLELFPGERKKVVDRGSGRGYRKV